MNFLRNVLLVMVLLWLGQANTFARERIGPGPYDALYLAKFMPNVPCSQLIEQVLQPNRGVNPLEDSKLLEQLTGCEQESKGAYAFVARKIVEGKFQIRMGNYFLGWESLLKGQERLDELPWDAPLRQYFMMTMGNAYQNTGAMELSVPYFKESLRIHFEREKPINTNLINVYNKLSRAYHKLENRDSSLYFVRKGVSYCSEYPQTHWYASSLNNLGLRFQSFGQLDSAMNYFRASWEIQEQVEHPMELHGAILDNIASVHLQQGEYREAYQYYRQSFDFARRNEMRGRLMAGGGKAITTLLESPVLGAPDLETAHEIMAVLDSIVDSPRFKRNSAKIEYMLRAKVSIQIAEGNLLGTSNALKNYEVFRDSLTEKVNRRRIKALERFLVTSAEKYSDQLTLADLEAENSRETLQYILIISLLLLVLLAFLGITMRNKVKNQRTQLGVNQSEEKLKQLELDNSELRKKELEQKLALQKRDMDDLAIEMRVRSKDRSDLIDQLEGILKTSSPSIQLRVLLNDLRSEADHQQISEVRLGKMEQVGNGFKERLTEKFPELTRTDVELCELFLLEIPVKEIAGIRKITPQSVRMGRYRIRKKLGLTGEEDLRDFLKEV